MGLMLSRALARLLGYQKEVRIVMVSMQLLSPSMQQHLPGGAAAANPWPALPQRLCTCSCNSIPGACSPLQLGLDAAGKTTVLYKLKLGEVVTTIPTIGEPKVFVI